MSAFSAIPAKHYYEQINAKYDQWKDAIGDKPVDVVADSLATANKAFQEIKAGRKDATLFKKLTVGREYLLAVFRAKSYVDENLSDPIAATEDFKALDYELRNRTLSRATNAMWFVLAMDVVNAVGMGIGNTEPLKQLKKLTWETVFAVGGKPAPSSFGTWLDYVGQFRSMWQDHRYPFPESDVAKLPPTIVGWLNGGLPSIGAAVKKAVEAEKLAAASEKEFL